MSTVIIDYGSGNLHSVHKAFERAAYESGEGGEIIVSSDPALVRSAERIVLPGVGAFADCRKGLNNATGMVEALTETVLQRGKPFLGICVGMQLLATRGLEYVTTNGLDWIPGDVRLIEPADATLKIPHMGWNTLDVLHPHALLDGIPTGPDGLHAYFVHSYALYPEHADDLVAKTDYAGSLTAMVARGNIAGVQFHPEKSQALGLALIANFMRWRP